MKNIKLLNKISKYGTEKFDTSKYNVSEAVENPDAIMVRSASMHDMEFGKELLAVARCGAGVNNIPCDKCAEQGIVVFNTPGANANGVKELAIASLLMASRDIVGGIEWAKSLEGTEDIAKAVEKGKSAFVGPELKGKTLGIIGLGAIGGMVANAALALGMNVLGCDPYMTVDAAWRLDVNVKKAETFEDVYAASDYISIHVPATPQTKGMINADTLALMKDGVRIINLSRADLVNVADMKAALESGKVARYVTDFPNNETVGVKGIVTTPHLGASTPESEDNCAVMAAEELIDFIENGNIRHSVNYPDTVLPKTGTKRIVVLHENIPNVLTNLSGVFGSDGINIEGMINRSKNTKACTLIDTNSDITEKMISDIAAVEGVIRVRVI
ncbi:MAG: 3-phosphoglycerate dehydrogenase [Ruminococcaceae bacterium]|nr:3-phosphoglycerate dehydrogenase [Oscillospiraceae bacterium]